MDLFNDAAAVVKGSRIAHTTYGTVSREEEQSRSLLAQIAADDDRHGPTPTPKSPPLPHSSFSRTSSNGFTGTPHIMDRVQPDVGEMDSGDHRFNGHACITSRESGEWPVAGNSFSEDDSESRRDSVGQRAPLLTDIEAPSIVVAEDLDFNTEGLLENARPKSGLM